MRITNARLEDQRGVWTERPLETLLNEAGEAADEFDPVVWVPGNVWRRFAFTRGEDGVYRAPLPAIGAIADPLSPLYVPDGWHAPEAK